MTVSLKSGLFLVPLLVAGLAPSTHAQIVVTETLPVSGSSFVYAAPGRILQRVYTGSWTLDWELNGTIFVGDSTVLHTLRVVGVIGGGNLNFGTNGIDQGGPIPVFPMNETFTNVPIGTPQSTRGTLQGSVQAFAGNATSSQLNVERWRIEANHPDANTYVDGLLDPNFSIGDYTATGRFDGTVTLDYEVLPYPNSPICQGGAALESYGSSQGLLFLRSPNASTSTAAILVEGVGLPGTSMGICLGNPRRVPGSLQQTSASGEYRFRIDPFAYPVGTTSSFQLWYRTPMGSDFSDAIEVLIR